MSGRHFRWALVALMAFTVLATLKNSYDQREASAGLARTAAAQQAAAEQARAQAECQTKRNEAFAANIKIRSLISTASDDAKSQLLSSVGYLVQNPATSEAEQAEQKAEYARLFQQYDDQVQAVKQARAANPLPDLEAPC